MRLFSKLMISKIHFGAKPRIIETRARMIDYHNRFLTQALQPHRKMPRIPRRRVDQGGYQFVRKHKGARAFVKYFWGHLLGT